MAVRTFDSLPSRRAISRSIALPTSSLVATHSPPGQPDGISRGVLVDRLVRLLENPFALLMLAMMHDMTDVPLVRERAEVARWQTPVNSTSRPCRASPR